MHKLDEARRAFLIGAAVGTGAAAGGALLPDAFARSHEQQAAGMKAPGHVHGHGAFLSDDESATVAALAERLMPGAPGKPGATDAGALNYIDLALAGAYADQRDFYRRGLAALDGYCRAAYNAPFVRLDAGKQDAVITALEEGKATGFTWPSAQVFFNALRTHTMEAMFADPVYGGNRDFVGWVLVGFPGAQELFSPADVQSKEAFAGAPIMGLQAQSKTPLQKI